MPPNGESRGRTRHGGAAPRSILVWDLPTRLFHWSVVLLVGVSLVTGNIGGEALAWHFLSGYAILALLVFRLAWGFVGTHHARFASFVRGPRATLRYARRLMSGSAEKHLGHNPLGAWSVLAMLASLALQVGTGLFANDDIATEGPLVHLVSRSTSDFLTRFHHWNRMVLLALVAIHVAAVAWHALARREPLVRAMLSGRKAWTGSETPGAQGHRFGVAIVILGFAAAGVWWLVTGGRTS
jgi:cytochrome b